MGYANGDFDGDTNVDIIDFGIFADNLGLDFRLFDFVSDDDGDYDVDGDDLQAFLNDPLALAIAFELFNFGVDIDVA